eukprot:jgi/Chlat1/6393/Chrsp44S05841
MRRRDLGVLLAGVVCLFLLVRREGGFGFEAAWRYPLGRTWKAAWAAGTTGEPLPPPVVADLNGDGRLEVLLATHDAKLLVLDPAAPADPDADTFAQAKVLAQVSLLPSAPSGAPVRFLPGRRAIALATGHLDPPPSPSAGNTPRRKRVIVVVTTGWQIMCYDHNLQLVWETSVKAEWPDGAHWKEVTVLINSHRMHAGDRGVVIIGGAMKVDPQVGIPTSHTFTSFLLLLGSMSMRPFTQGAEARWEDEEDPLEEELAWEQSEELHARSADDKAPLEDIKLAEGKERHFSYYAFAGGTGELRWRHESTDFVRDHSAMSEELLPQHNYKLDATALNGKHFGEVECREYRDAVLAVMPHKWDDIHDTRFRLAHFQKTRKKVVAKQGVSPPPKPIHGHDNALAQGIKKVVGAAKGSKGGRRAELLSKPEKGSNGDGNNGQAHNHVDHNTPNVLVAHLQEGIEAVHLFTGRTVCQLHLPHPGVHADINGDGVLDHVQAVDSHGSSDGQESHHRLLRRCWAVATSGVPVREQLFNGSICRMASRTIERMFARNVFGDDSERGIAVAPPVLLPRRHIRHGHHTFDSLFFNSFGEYIAGPSWPASKPGTTHHVVPTLEAFSLRSNAVADIVLVAGESRAILLSASGEQLTSFELESAPVERLVRADFTGDGFNDIILVGADGVYGYAQVRRPGAVLFAALLACLIVGMGIVFVMQKDSSKAQTRG